jgi:hypothetical protein
MQEVCIDPQIKTESLIPLQTVILGNQQQMNPSNGAPQQNGQLIPNAQQPKLGTNCDKSRAPDNAYWMPTETGFINSQPSMAEFLTHLGPDSSPKMDQTPYGNASEETVPEYPWMKEKKTARKNNQSSESNAFSVTSGARPCSAERRSPALSISPAIDFLALIISASFRCPPKVALISSATPRRWEIDAMQSVIEVTDESRRTFRGASDELSRLPLAKDQKSPSERGNPSKNRILIINLLFVFICQTQKKNFKLRDWRRRKRRRRERRRSRKREKIVC